MRHWVKVLTRALAGKELKGKTQVSYPQALLSSERMPSEDKPSPQLQQVFTDVYLNNHFQGRESISGPGSNLVQTQTVQQQLPLIIQALGIKTLLDAPCGDYYWMQNVQLDGLDLYVGVDIVNELIEANQRKYENPKRQFLSRDITIDSLPTVDLILCRDCLVHLPFQSIFSALENFKRSGARYLLTTTFVNRSENYDISPGLWRPINLEVAPFCLPSPEQIINEQCTEDNGQYLDKSLGLWKISQLPNHRWEVGN
jgi:hypothetical protein